MVARGTPIAYIINVTNKENARQPAMKRGSKQILQYTPHRTFLHNKL